MAVGLRRQLRCGVPRRAAGVPDPDDAAEPEILRAGRRRRQAASTASCWCRNIETADPRAIVHGNERVLRARLADAKFFFDQDRKQPLASRVAKLASVVYHNKLGTQGERVERVRASPREIAPLVGADARWPIAPRCSPRPTSSPTWSANSPNCRARWAATTRCTTANRRRSPTRSRSTTGRASPATRCRQVRWRRRSRSPTSSRRWPACSASARRRPATRIRSACVARRSACCASWSKSASRRRSRRWWTRVRVVRAAFAGFGDARAATSLAFLYERLRGYLRDQGYTANEVAAVVDGAPSEYYLIPGAARSRPRVRGAARSAGAGGGQQAHRQHPAQGRHSPSVAARGCRWTSTTR